MNIGVYYYASLYWNKWKRLNIILLSFSEKLTKIYIVQYKNNIIIIIMINNDLFSFYI